MPKEENITLFRLWTHKETPQTSPLRTTFLSSLKKSYREISIVYYIRWVWCDSQPCVPNTDRACYEVIYHYSDVIMGAIASQITSLTIIYSAVYSSANQRKHQSSTSLAFVRGIHWWPVNSPHKWPVTRKMFAFDDVIITYDEFHAQFILLSSW